MIQGPSGFGPEGFVEGDIFFPYTIEFENKPDATAPAQTVVVTQQLDDDLDWTTFHLGSIGFGDIVVNVPSGRTSFSTRVDAVPSRGVYVDVTADFNPLTGEVTWTFTSLDPATLDVPADPFAGFLPPNDDSAKGQGFVTYTIRPKIGLPTGTRIDAEATIVFDTNEPLATDPIVNTLDVGPPTSTVLPLPPTTTTTTFDVSWAGEDDAGGSGIAGYDVYVSDNGGAFSLLLHNTTQTSASVTGQDGHTYAFYSVAVDNIGHVEPTPASAQAFTQVLEDRPPELAPVGDRSVAEGTLLSFTAVASDPDLPAQPLTFGLSGAPAGAGIDPMSGVFTWTPTEAQGPGSFTFDVVVSDGTLTDSETITVTVGEVNVAPVLSVPGPQTVDELAPLTFSVTAADADVPGNTLTFSASGLPAGATFDPATRTFNWTPTEAQGPGTFTVTFMVTDGAATDSETITITVNEVNLPPILDAIGDRSVDEEQTLSFVINASDVDLPANTLSYSATDLPNGANFDPLTRTFSWTPTEVRGPGSFMVTFTVNDGTATDSETITITVNEVNQAPILDPIGDQSVNEEQTLSFAINATDPDLPANTLTYSATGLPTGASFDPPTRMFSWTPTEAQGPGSFMVNFTVSDGTLTDSETITLTVNEVNRPPVLSPIGNRSVNEESELSFVINATDPDLPANTLTYSATGLPTGANFDPLTRTFSWTPTEAQGPGTFTVTFSATDGTLTGSEMITIAVNEVNQPPVLAPIGDRSVNEEQTLSFTISGSDVDVPANTLTYSATGLPNGANFDPLTRAFSWTPTEAQGPGNFLVTFTVNDGTATDSEVVTVTVNEVNLAPVLGAIGNRSVDEEQPLSFAINATDMDLPANTMTFSATGLPSGASFDPLTRAFSWTPTEAQGPGNFPVTFTVSDGTLTDSETITITVNEVNQLPLLAAIGNRSVDEEQTLSFVINGTDDDLPANTLTFSATNLPPGAAFNPATRTFTWTPTSSQAGTYQVTFSVSDGLATSSETITIAVRDVPTTTTTTLLPRGVLGSLIRKKSKKGTKLFIRLTFADTGELKGEILSPFQKPQFSAVSVATQDGDGDGIPDTAVVKAKKGKQTLTRLFA